MALETPTVGMSNTSMRAQATNAGTDFIADTAVKTNQAIADELDKYSALVLQMQIKADKEKAEAQALSLGNKMQEELQKNQLEYSQLKNKDAIDGYDSYKQNISNIIEKYTPTDEAQPLTQKLVSEKATRLRTASNSSLMAYQMEQIASWKNLEMQSALDLSIDDSITFYGKPQFEDKLFKTLDKQDFIADQKGIDINSDAYKLQRLQTTSKVHFNGIMNEINREMLGSASSHLNKYTKQLTAEDRNRLIIELESAKARAMAKYAPKELTEADMMQFYRKEFDGLKHLHVADVDVQYGETLKGVPLFQKEKKAVVAGDPMYDVIREQYVNKMTESWKFARDATRTVQGNIFYLGFKEYNKYKAQGVTPPSSARMILDSIGQTDKADASTIDKLQAYIKRDTQGIGNAGNPMATGEIRAGILDGTLANKTRDELVNLMNIQNMNSQEQDKMLELHEKINNQEFSSTFKQYESTINDFISLELAIDPKSSDFKDRLAFNLLHERISDDIKQRAKRPENKGKDFLELFTMYTSDPMVRSGLNLKIKEANKQYDEQVKSAGTLAADLTPQELLEFMGFKYGAKQKNPTITEEQVFASWLEQKSAAADTPPLNARNPYQTSGQSISNAVNLVKESSVFKEMADVSSQEFKSFMADSGFAVPSFDGDPLGRAVEAVNAQDAMQGYGDYFYPQNVKPLNLLGDHTRNAMLGYGDYFYAPMAKPNYFDYREAISGYADFYYAPMAKPNYYDLKGIMQGQGEHYCPTHTANLSDVLATIRAKEAVYKYGQYYYPRAELTQEDYDRLRALGNAIIEGSADTFRWVGDTYKDITSPSEWEVKIDKYNKEWEEKQRRKEEKSAKSK